VAGQAVDGVPPPVETDLALLVSAITDAFAATGRPAPRRPWPDPLPAEVDLDALIDASIEAGRALVGPGARGFVPLAVADDPEAQAQYPVGWYRHEGNLVVYGIGGSGTTTALTSLALSLARTQSPDDMHMYAMDFGAGELGAIAPLPHVGAVILAAERERQTRLMRFLRGELDRRRDLGATAARDEPAIVTFVDGWTSLVAEYNDLAGSAHWEAFTRVFADGPEVGLFTVVAADRAGAVSHALASLVRQRMALRLGDKGDYSNFGIRMANVPEMVPGRAITITDRQVVQIARPADGAEAAARRLASSIPAPARPPVRMDLLTTEVRLPDLGAAAELGARPWTLPIGVAESARATAHLMAYQGEHALIVGPARSGKSTALLTVAAACRAARGDVRVVAVAGPRSPIGADPLVDHAIHPNQIGEALMPLVEPGDGLMLVLVDDAEAIDDVGGVLDKLSTSDRADLLFVAAGRNDGVRTGYSHWTRPLRRSKLGVMLRPDVDLDGDIFGTRLPRRSPVAMVAGRGYLAANGNVELVQVALPR
jgi:DNA segregation ATPase FtsK/SpoIIIE, S-DNA-T family